MHNLLALLYPDGGMSDDEELSGQTEDMSSLDSELEGLLGLRSLFSAMPEQEPSDAVTNSLLAMAAKHAPSPKKAPAEAGIWAWFSNLVMPLATHPGLAAAASLVLVAGVAGTLYYQNGGQVAEPLAASEATRPGLAAPNVENTPEPKSDRAEVFLDSVATEVSESSSESREGAQAADVPSDEFVQVGGEAAPPQEVTQKLGRAAPAPASQSSGRKDSADKIVYKPVAKKRKSSAGKSLMDSRAKSAKNKAPQKSSRTKGRSTGGLSPEVRAPSPAPEPDFVRSLVTETDDEDFLKEKKSEDARVVPTGKAAALHRQAQRAAKNGDCATVRKIGQQIRKLDSAYYDRTYLSDSGLKACRLKSSAQ
ncbi:MAG: hypothetical protein JKY56_16595 [Kofleriaceae bacterium]|nr:hypothetical protein [Kofleriaceae bacterium]